jgi:hypothetical protein
MNEERRTIVGGRSRSDRLIGDFPRGIEILVKKASVDSVFKQLLLRDPLNAARSIMLDLKPVEINILTNTSISVLQSMISNIRVPKQHIKTFRTGTIAAIFAILMSTTVVSPLLAGGQMDLPEQSIDQEELEAYKNDYGTYPSTCTWFEVPGLLTEYAPLSDFYDPWKRRFHYNAVRERGMIVNYKLESLGLDDKYYDDNIPCPIDTDEHRFTGVSPINIIYPLEGHTITTDELSDGILEIRAEHENEMVYINWYLNEVCIGYTVKDHTMTTEPDPGENILLLVDENEESTSIHFLVSEKEVSQ